MRTIIIASLFASSLSACVVMPSDPLVQAANLIGYAASGVRSMTPNPPQNAVIYDQNPIHEVCIEWNGAVAMSDFVPALQNELIRRGVQSRVYDAGTQSVGCQVTMTYTGFVKWDTKVFSDAYTPYLTYVSLTLRRDGRVMGSAQYRLGSFAQDKWATTNEKLGPLVDALLPSNTEVIADSSRAPAQQATGGF